MKRNQYIITKTNGDTLTAWANGYDVSQYGTLSLGQIAEFNGQTYTALVLSMQPSEWKTIHQVDGDRPKYLETGTIEKAGFVIQ